MRSLRDTGGLVRTCVGRQMVLLTVAGAGFPVQWALSEYPLSRFKMTLWLSPPPNCIRNSHAPTKNSGTEQPLKNPNEIQQFTNRPRMKSGLGIDETFGENFAILVFFNKSVFARHYL